MTVRECGSVDVYLVTAIRGQVPLSSLLSGLRQCWCGPSHYQERSSTFVSMTVRECGSVDVYLVTAKRGQVPVSSGLSGRTAVLICTLSLLREVKYLCLHYCQGLRQCWYVPCHCWDRSSTFVSIIVRECGSVDVYLVTAKRGQVPLSPLLSGSVAVLICT